VHLVDEGDSSETGTDESEGCLRGSTADMRGSEALLSQGAIANYTWSDLVAALKSTGLCPGDVVFFQISHESLGNLNGETSQSTEYELLYAAIREVIGWNGIAIIPSFSCSFEKNEDFDINATPNVQGRWSHSIGFLEYCRQLPDAVRSSDPNRAVLAVGPGARDFMNGLPCTTYGKDCVHERLLRIGGKICGIGVPLADAEFLHFVEETMMVPFRYKKLFTGRVREDGNEKKLGWITSVPIQAPNGTPDGSRIEKIARSEIQGGWAKLGNGEVHSVDCAQFYELVRREIERDSWITARGPAGKSEELDSIYTGTRPRGVQLSPGASMEELIAALWRLPRDIVSDGYDTALRALSEQVPMTVHEYATGTECWTWLVPEKWTCHEAWLETSDGHRLFSYADNPLHVVSYSLPIDREVSREELFDHLHVHPELPDAVPFVFKYYERDWGLCCSKTVRDSLSENRYRVVIRSQCSYGKLKVGEVIVPGRSEKSFVLCAHLCHPAMVNDDLSGVAVGISVMKELLSRRALKFTYRLLILPETIGSVAYLSHNEGLIPQMIGGLFLEMLALDNPHALQLSFAGDSRVDRCLTQVLAENDLEGWVGPFRTVVGNDERQFNAPGVRVPMLSLSRVRKTQKGSWPYYPEYHSSFDTPERASFARLNESRTLVLRMIDALETDCVPINRFQGEIFCSRYGLNIDVYQNPESNKALFDIIFSIDGTRSLADIARQCGVPIEAVTEVTEKLRKLGLVEYSEV
jgi:aminopeptidase-like protein/aminoglycoside N3'-acetyltransferase